jgi:hypothetical protein
MHPSGTLFFWGKALAQPSRLITSLGVSLLAHLLVFQLFWVLGPEHATSPAPAPELTVLSREIPEHRSLLESIQAQFPTAARSHPKLSSEPWLRSDFHASHHWLHTEPLLPPLPPSTSAPALGPARSLSETSLASAHGRLLLSAPLQNRTPRSLGMALPSPSRNPGGSARFWIAVRPSGEVAHVFLQSPSLIPEEARAMEAFLHQVRFEPDPTAPDLQWGQATLQPIQTSAP